MKGYVIIVLFVLVSCSKEVIITEEEIKPDLFYRSNDVSPYTGNCKVLFNDTNLLKEKFRFKNGILDGDAEAFYRDGKLRWKGKYKNGCSVGKWEYWDLNGKKTIEANYVNDSLNGPFYSWYSNGLIKEKGQYCQNSRAGIWVSFNETGQVISETIY